ncbi:MAG: response regulator [Dehalococcoidia bacterium]|nr:MAG: response regulator [Dehalococcoidia bacterium]
MPEPATRAVDAPPPGWLLVDAGGTIRRADTAACALLGLSETGSVLGREVRSLVARADRIRWPEPWPGPGLTWTGALRFEVAEVAVALVVEMVGLVSGEGWAIRLAVPTGGLLPDVSSTITPAPADAPLAAAEALDASDSPAAVRGVLQALDNAMPFDFGCVIRFVGGGGLVVATYPTAMAGVATGDAWSRLDEAEMQVRDRGEPVLDGDLRPLGADEIAVTPLWRLPAFGLRSRMHVPLFAGSEIAGTAILYRRSPRGFSGADGWLAERTLRRVGDRLRAPITPAAAVGVPTAAATPAASAVPDEATSAARFDALGDLVAGVAHELNNPLTSILGYAQILDTLEGTDREHALHTIEEESQRAARIMRNLLQFARQDPDTPLPPAGVQLPLVPEQAPRTIARTPEAHEPGSGIAAPVASRGRLLVIEADPAIRVLTSEILSGGGYQVTSTADGAQGVQEMMKGHFDAVIADQAMRGLDASTFVEWMEAHTRELLDRIIFVADDLLGERPRLPDGVVARYLERPFDAQTLLDTVEGLVGTRA